MIKGLIPSAFLITFVLLMVYRWLAPMGICEQVNLFTCNFYMDQVVRFMYFFGIVGALSAAAALHSPWAWSRWSRFALFAVPLSLVVLYFITIGGLHGETAGSFGLGDIVNRAIDKFATIFVYVLFAGISLVLIFRKGRAQSPKSGSG